MNQNDRNRRPQQGIPQRRGPTPQQMYPQRGNIPQQQRRPQPQQSRQRMPQNQQIRNGQPQRRLQQSNQPLPRRSGNLQPRPQQQQNRPQKVQTNETWYTDSLTPQEIQGAPFPQYPNQQQQRQHQQQKEKPIVVDKQSNKKKTEKPKKVVDYIIWFIFAGVAVLLAYLVYSMNMLAFKYILAIAGILGLVVLLFLIGIMCRKKKSWRMWVSRVTMTGITCAMAFGSYTIFNSMRVLDNMTNSDSLMRVSLATVNNAESAPSSLQELAGKCVGYSIASDKNAVCYAISRLAETNSDVKFIAYKDYTELYKALESGEIASAIIPNARVETIKSEIENYEQSVKYLTTYTSVRNPKDKVAEVVETTPEQPFVVYLAGLGEAGDASVDELTDVNILAFIDPSKREVTTVSIPRDSFVPNPALNSGSDKLTHLGMDGVYNSMTGLEKTFGIEIDYYARVSFTSIIELVDAIGGVTVDVEIPFTEQDENRSFDYNNLITLNAGQQKLNGKQALAYARHRKGYFMDGTAGRERAQQKIIKAMIEQICTPQGMANINNVLNVAEKYVSTNIPMSVIQGIIKQETNDPQAWKVRSMTLENVQNASLTTVSMPSLQLSCQLLMQSNLDQVYTLYQALIGKASMSVDELMTSYEQHQKQNEQNIEQGLAEDTTFFVNLTSPAPDDYVITYEESPYINTMAPVYGLDNTANYNEPDIHTRMRVTVPKLSSGYYE